MPTFTVNSNYPAILLLRGDPDNPVSTLIANTDSANTIYIGTDPAMQPTDQTVIPLPSGTSIVATGIEDVYGICETGVTASASTLGNTTSAFSI